MTGGRGIQGWDMKIAELFPLGENAEGAPGALGTKRARRTGRPAVTRRQRNRCGLVMDTTRLRLAAYP